MVLLAGFVSRLISLPEPSRPGLISAVLVRFVFSAPANGWAALANNVRVTVSPIPAGKSPSSTQVILFAPEQVMFETEAAPATVKLSSY
ncbi:hypothetical protein D3C86_1829480 [compost metagenome]